MELSFEFINQTTENLDAYEKEFTDIIHTTMQLLKIEDDIELSCIIVDDNEIHRINREYRNIDRPTDVISFALEDDKTFNLQEIRVLGDIYISIEKARSQALEYGHSFKRELSFLAIHGFLHLLGYDHMEKDEEEIMFKKQEEVLSRYEINR